jgi:acetylornithine deacetylase/succinyl-diaminopimelate desuccinylase-like protein
MKRLAFILAFAVVPALGQTPDWTKVHDEAMRHLRALVQIDSTDPPGNETRVIDYLKKALDAEGIPSIVDGKDPARQNLIARIRGNGTKRPLIIMGHADTVRVEPEKWTFPPFSATLDGGWVYGRGTRDDKSDVVADLMTMVLLKRLGVKLDRDVIFISEAGEEAATQFGIEYLVDQHWKDIDADVCIAEGGGVNRKGGKPIFATIQTTEKRPMGVTLEATGSAGHASMPRVDNAIVHLAGAVEKIANWEPPTEFNDTTRTYFEKLANVSNPEDAARYKALFDSSKSAAVHRYMAENDPQAYSMLHTSISPTILQGGKQVNVIPSAASATLDIRAMPGEDIDRFYDLMRGVINDPQVKIVPNPVNGRPAADPSSITSDAYHAIEAAYGKIYNVPSLPLMGTGATDKAFLRAKGMQCYGVGAMADVEDTAKGFASHSDQERILVDAVYRHVEFIWDAVQRIAAAKN